MVRALPTCLSTLTLVLLGGGCSAPPAPRVQVDPDLGHYATRLAPGYEPGQTYAAKDLLPSNLHHSSLHTVDPLARLDGLQARFRLTTRYGTYVALGAPRVVQILAEVRAIHMLRAQPTQGFGRGLTESLPKTFQAIRTLLQRPRWALQVWPSSLREALRELRALSFDHRNVHEDSFVTGLLTVTKFKRRIAHDLQVDVFSPNPLLQYELNRLGWEAAAGNWAPTVLTAPVNPGIAISLLHTALTTTATFETYLRETNATQIRIDTERTLPTWGVTPATRERLQSNPHVSPVQQAWLVELLRGLPHARQREAAVAWLAESKRGIRAFYKLHALKLLGAMTEDPVVELVRCHDLLVAQRQSNKRVLPLVGDLVLWTPWLEKHLRAARGEGQPLELRLEGRLSDLAQRRVADLGVTTTYIKPGER